MLENTVIVSGLDEVTDALKAFVEEKLSFAFHALACMGTSPGYHYGISVKVNRRFSQTLLSTDGVT